MNKALLKKLLFALLCIIALIVVAYIVIRYEAEGDKNMPFKISKILMISTVDGAKVEDAQNLWNISLSQVNDLYIYIDKSNDNDKETIKSIKFDNFYITRPSGVGETKIYKPTGDLANLYNQSKENYVGSEIVYVGDRIDDLKAGIMSNIGGTIGFRYAIENLGAYVSNDDTEIVLYNGSLLNKVGITNDKITSKLNFDVTITTNDNVIYKGTISLDTPAGNLGEEGSSNLEITDFDNVVFKRVKE